MTDGTSQSNPDGTAVEKSKEARREPSPSRDEQDAGGELRPTVSEQGERPSQKVRAFQEVDRDEYLEEISQRGIWVEEMMRSRGWTDVTAPYLQDLLKELGDITTVEKSLEELVGRQLVVKAIKEFIETLDTIVLQGQMSREELSSEDS